MVIVWAVLICVLAPVVEEFFFRGFMFTVLARRMGVVWAMIVDGIVFGIGHAAGAEIIQLLALGAFGMGLCLLYWRTQSIIPCMALHALNNSITFGVAKDLEPALFAGVVVVSVGTVVGGGHGRLGPSPGGGRMRRSALALPRGARAASHGRRPDPSARADPGAHARSADVKLSSSALGHARRLRPAALAGRSFTARVVMKPFVADESAVLRVYRGKKKILVKSLTFKAVDGGTAGVATFKVQLEARRLAGDQGLAQGDAGRRHAAREDAARQRRRARTPNTGSSGPAVRLLQGKLAAMKYVVPRTGVYDAGTGRAVMAWRKVAGFSRTYVATRGLRRPAQGQGPVQGPPPR